jgi:hypothetical protein
MPGNEELPPVDIYYNSTMRYKRGRFVGAESNVKAG